jgi:hypothetical protein
MPPMRRLRTLPLLLLTAPAWAEPQLMTPFLEGNCLDCHDRETQKGGLNLENLAFNPVH